MGRYPKVFFPLLLALVSVSVGCSSGQGVNPGDLAPSFSLPLVAGRVNDVNGTARGQQQGVGSQLRLESFKGKVVVLNFFASWCEPCIAELPALERLAMAGRSSGIVVIGVGIDDHASALQAVVSRTGVTFPVVLDEHGTSKASYRIAGVPESFILDKEQRFVLYPDPERGPVLRIVGPQQWDAGPLRSFLLSLSKM